MARAALITTFLLLVASVFTACASGAKATQVSLTKDYQQKIEKITVEDELYNGFSNVFHYTASLQTQSLRRAQLEHLRKVQLWSDDEYQKELRQLEESRGVESLFFLSFFTPDLRYNDLNESGSVWRIFLDVDGKRYSAKVSKYTRSYADTKALYPKHTPWGKAYLLKFPIPLRQLERVGKVRLVITGNLGVSKRELSLN